MRSSARPKNWFKAVLVVSAFVVFAASCLQREGKTPVTITSSERPDTIPERVSDKTFKNFSHEIEEHKKFDCTSCHRRDEKVLDNKFAGHESCVGCHLNQFTASEPAMCSICHDDLKSSPPTMKTFPAKFIEGFNMKFDHAAHESGKARPPAGCVACHEPQGPGKSIPSGIKAHANCYTCHTPDTKIGSCSTCHEIAPYSRTPQSRYVFRAVFTHGDHGKIGCNECHNVIAKAGQGKQVTSIAAQEHNVGQNNNCNTCHNGSRAFGGNGPNDFANCSRCHKGRGFDMLPGSPK